VKDIAVGAAHSCAVTTEGTFCVGNNAFGSLGAGSAEFASTAFLRVVGLPNATPTAIAAGHGQTCVIANGEVYCWGDNSFAASGNGVGDPSGGAAKVWQRYAAKVHGIMGRPQELALGVWRSCVSTDQGVQCWGANDSGQLGRGLTPHLEEVDPDFVRATPLR
jgi:alpha-tubulin suppressor-like RCC1 family protein